jgi:hypothetical protein
VCICNRWKWVEREDRHFASKVEIVSRSLKPYIYIRDSRTIAWTVAASMGLRACSLETQVRTLG